MHERLKELFERAVALPPQDRLTFLVRECGEDTELYQELVSLLEADEANTWPIDVAAFLQTDHQSIIKEFYKIIEASENDARRINNRVLKPGERIGGRYEIISDGAIGNGGTGHVYLAIDTNFETNNKVAVKRLRPRYYVDEHIYISKQFQREAEILRNLRHPGIPDKIDFVKENGEIFLIMEYIVGNDLELELKQRDGEPFDTKQVLHWADELLTILDYVHNFVPEDSEASSDNSKAIIHRDIKPSNLKIRSGRLMLIDFGFAKSGMLDLTNSDPQFNPYTLHFASPEQLNNEPPTVLFDIYSVGATLYSLLTGIVPMDARYRSQVILGGNPDPLKPVDRLNKEVPSSLSVLIRQAMSLDPDDRPKSASEMQKTIRKIKNEVYKPRLLHLPVYAVAGIALLTIISIFIPNSSTWLDRLISATTEILAPYAVVDPLDTIPNDSLSQANSHDSTKALDGDTNSGIAPLSASPPASALSRTVTSNFYMDRLQGDPLNGRGIIKIDDTALNASLWNAFTLSVGEHAFSASFRGMKAKRVTMSFQENGQPQSEAFAIDTTGVIRLTITPEMKNLRMIFYL